MRLLVKAAQCVATWLMMLARFRERSCRPGGVARRWKFGRKAGGGTAISDCNDPSLGPGLSSLVESPLNKV